MVAGELWRARAAGETTVPRGARVRVREAHGLTLIVEPEAAAKERP
jgi:membrane protein implicated in regulation of membrane protease activity